ncbi:MAG: hypothetical protein JXR40_04215 [Pontiellaceae bacterium]|nr:hypothetical protein [Pontiellaceae bacterium]
MQNLDPESETYREHKQFVVRINRTYKFHPRPRAGFKDFDGASLFVVQTGTVIQRVRLRPQHRLDNEKRDHRAGSCLLGF